MSFSTTLKLSTYSSIFKFTFLSILGLDREILFLLKSYKKYSSICFISFLFFFGFERIYKNYSCLKILIKSFHLNLFDFHRNLTNPH